MRNAHLRIFECEWACQAMITALRNLARGKTVLYDRSGFQGAHKTGYLSFSLYGSCVVAIENGSVHRHADKASGALMTGADHLRRTAAVVDVG